MQMIDTWAESVCESFNERVRKDGFAPHLEDFITEVIRAWQKCPDGVDHTRFMRLRDRLEYWVPEWKSGDIMTESSIIGRQRVHREEEGMTECVVVAESKPDASRGTDYLSVVYYTEDRGQVCYRLYEIRQGKRMRWAKPLPGVPATIHNPVLNPFTTAEEYARYRKLNEADYIEAMNAVHSEVRKRDRERRLNDQGWERDRVPAEVKSLIARMHRQLTELHRANPDSVILIYDGDSKGGRECLEEHMMDPHAVEVMAAAAAARKGAIRLFKRAHLSPENAEIINGFPPGSIPVVVFSDGVHHIAMIPWQPVPCDGHTETA